VTNNNGNFEIAVGQKKETLQINFSFTDLVRQRAESSFRQREREKIDYSDRKLTLKADFYGLTTFRQEKKHLSTLEKRLSDKEF